jgi:CheY-like chemotaxis protein
MNISLHLTRPTDSLPLRKERILVADDNLVSQQFTVANLRKLGFSADVVTNGLEALNALKTKQYDVILMDCEMPALDGYEATKEIRRQERNGRHTWIIAMTAYAVVGDREKCLKAGMDDYINKPLRHEELRTALERGMARP